VDKANQSRFIAVTDEVLKDMTQAIVDAVHPEKIILFGSHARGKTHADSDVDLIVIEAEEFGPTRSRVEELSRIRAALSGFHVPKDLLVYSRAEEDDQKTLRCSVVYTGTREGRVLYERTS